MLKDRLGYLSILFIEKVIKSFSYEKAKSIQSKIKEDSIVVG